MIDWICARLDHQRMVYEAVERPLTIFGVKGTIATYRLRCLCGDRLPYGEALTVNGDNIGTARHDPVHW